MSLLHSSSFWPLHGRMGKAADMTCKRLAAMIDEIRDTPYSQVILISMCIKLLQMCMPFHV